MCFGSSTKRHFPVLNCTLAIEMHFASNIDNSKESLSQSCSVYNKKDFLLRGKSRCNFELANEQKTISVSFTYMVFNESVCSF